MFPVTVKVSVSTLSYPRLDKIIWDYLGFSTPGSRPRVCAVLHPPSGQFQHGCSGCQGIGVGSTGEAGLFNRITPCL